MQKAVQLPQIRSKSYSRSHESSFSVPFSQVKLQMGELSFHVNTESSDYWSSASPHHPMGLKSYDMVSMSEITNSRKHPNNEDKYKYKKVIINNPYVFYKRTGEFTNYINSSIKFNKMGPFNRKNAK